MRGVIAANLITLIITLQSKLTPDDPTFYSYKGSYWRQVCIDWGKRLEHGER